MSTAADAAQGFLNVVADPCLPQVGQLLFRLHELEATPDDPTQPPKPVQASLGIGLCKVVTPLKAVVFLRENPVIGVAAIAGFFGIFVGIGYRLGHRSGRRSLKP
jgi:hypothetical protein